MSAWLFLPAATLSLCNTYYRWTKTDSFWWKARVEWGSKQAKELLLWKYGALLKNISTRKLIKDWCRLNKKLEMQLTNQFGDSKNAVQNFKLDFLFAVRAEGTFGKLYRYVQKNLWLSRIVLSLYRIPFSEVNLGQLFAAVYVPF